MTVTARPLVLTRGAAKAKALELAVVAALAVAALAVRWPELMNVPRFTDEVLEVRVALYIARGEELPLVNRFPHIGALFNYLVAAAFLLHEPKIETARLVVWLLGALTVVPTYLLGRSVGGPVVGLLSALLLTTSSSHIAVNSHIAYSHSLTPLFSTAGLWLLHQAVTRRSGPHLVGSGLAFGLAFQTHPSALAVWPGLAVYLLLQGRTLIGRWLLLAGGAALLAVANLVVFNAMTGLSGVEKTFDRSTQYLAGSESRDYSWSGRFLLLLREMESWPERLLILAREVGTSLGGMVSETSQPYALLNPLVAAYTALALVGLVMLWRRREWLPGLGVLSGLLLLSFFNGRLENVMPRGRHYALLLPLCHLAVAVALVGFQQRVALLAPRRPRIAHLAALSLTMALVLAPMVFLHDYYQSAHRRGQTNVQFFSVLGAIDRSVRLDEAIYLDDELYATRTLSGGRLLDNFRVALEARGQLFDMMNVKNDRVLGRAPGASRVLVLDPGNVELASRRYRLEPLPGEPGDGAPLRLFRAYRA